MAIDYRNFNDGTGQTQVSADKKWWTLSKDEIPSAINGVTQFLYTHQSRRQTQNLLSARLYGNLSVMGLNGLTYSRVASVQNSLKDRISYNVIQSVIDTLVAKIAKNKPRPLFLTSGGNFVQQRRAKKLNKFCDGIFYENNAYQMGKEIFRDSCVFDAGVVHVFNHYGRVKWERVIPMEILVDEVEAFYGKPRQLHWIKNIDRQVLKDMFPDKKKQLSEVEQASPDVVGGYENISDVVTVRQSWHLPSGPDAKDGLCVISTTKNVLQVSAWEKPYFPFATIKYNPRLFGYWGQGLAEEIQNIQLEINKLLWVIQRSMHLAGSFKIWCKTGAKIVKEHLNNDIGAILESVEKPEYLVPPIVAPEVYSHLQTLIRLAFETTGISQLSAASQKPAGLNSGKALREYNDIETDRFMTTGQAYENLFLDLARLSIDCAKDIAEEEGGYKVKVPGKRSTDEIDWKDVEMDEDDYVMKLYPVSAFSEEPAAKLQEVQEYAQAGFISPRTAKRLLDFPDLETEEDLSTSQEEYLHKILGQMVDDGIYTAPDQAFDDLQLAKELVLQYYSEGRNGGLEEEKLELLRRFSDQVSQFELEAQNLAMAQAAAVSQPPASPEPGPTSDLIANQPVIGAA